MTREPDTKILSFGIALSGSGHNRGQPDYDTVTLKKKKKNRKLDS
jgi:hypothetical protein